ncbi:MAG TPA: hypothetical protein VGL75_04445 [Acidothermaceae bacterium]|jgi:hypothetical protein
MTDDRRNILREFPSIEEAIGAVVSLWNSDEQMLTGLAVNLLGLPDRELAKALVWGKRWTVLRAQLVLAGEHRIPADADAARAAFASLIEEADRCNELRNIAAHCHFQGAAPPGHWVRMSLRVQKRRAVVVQEPVDADWFPIAYRALSRLVDQIMDCTNVLVACGAID